MKLLIVGKNGQVGKSLENEIKKFPEINFLALDRAELDITDSCSVDKVIHDYNPNFIINAAAYTAVDNAEKEKIIANCVNVDGPRNLAISAEKHGACLLHISTDYVFSGEKKGLYSELDKVNPKTVYGKSKLKGEEVIALNCSSYIILRTSWVFSEFGNNFVSKMFELSKSYNSLNIVDDQLGGPTYAGDIASALIKIALSIYKGNTSYGIYHFSGHPYVSWKEFGIEIFDRALNKKLLKNPIRVNAASSEEYPSIAKRPKNSRLDCAKIANDFMIQPSDWKEGLKKVCDVIKRN